MNEPQKKSYDLAADVTKQLLTLSSATLVFAATILRDATPTVLKVSVISAAFLALFASILFGVRMLFVLTSILAGIRTDDDAAVPMVSRVPGAWAARLQHYFFFAGIVFLALFGLLRSSGL